MTKILKMEMKGFKSFATKTEMVFGDNFNCILGPNGSGKSNVLDALCFVLGKAGAKGLRVEKSGNLIYNGGKTKKPAKDGEVSIWFDNSQKIFPNLAEKEIKITRIIKQTGQGVYKINEKTTTRTAIVDLLGMAHINPDGYNIILQGDIVRLIEMSLNERRLIIEEIAGINIYENKKTKAMRELNRVEEKINEADIILTERESYLSELKKDRDKAQKYKDLEDKRKRNKKTIIVNNIKRRTEQIAKITTQIEDNNSRITKLEDEVKNLRLNISEKKSKIEDINREVEEKGEKEQVKIHKLVEELKVNVAVNNQRVETIKGEIQKLNDRQLELKSSHKEFADKIIELERKKKETQKRVQIRENDLEHVEKKILDFRKKHNLEAETETDQRIDAIDKEVEIIQEEMQKDREVQQELTREKDKVDMRLQSIDEKMEKLASIHAEHKKELEQLKHKKIEFKKATVELSKALSTTSDYASQLSNARGKVMSKREDLARLEGRRASIIEQVAGGTAIKAVMDLKKSEPGIFGTVAELGNVKEEYSVALEIAAGNKIKSIVVDSDRTAAKCIGYLKKQKVGVATFLPLNKIRSPTIRDDLRKVKSSGVKGLALDLISYDKKFRSVMEYVFGNTLVVESVNTARQLGVGSYRMATMTGDIVEMSGAMRGGYRQSKAKGLFGQEELNKQIENHHKEINDQEGVIATLENKQFEMEELINRLRSLKAELEGDIIKTEKSLHLDSEDTLIDNDTKKELKKGSKDLDKKIDNIQEKISSGNQKLAKLKIERQQLRDKILELRNPAKLAELKSFDEKRSELQQEIMQLKGESKHTVTEMETIIGPESRKILDIMKQHEKEEQKFASERKELELKVRGQQKELAKMEKQEAAFYTQFKELFTKRSKLTDDINKAESKIANHNTTIRSIEQKNNVIGLDNARLKAELSGFQEEDKYYEGVDPFLTKSEDLIKRELTEFEKMKEDFGAVNMRALEIYEEVEREYKSLQEKKITLAKEREDVLLMINEIDSKKKDLFMRTFEALEENFKRIFSQLLVKGDASLELEDKNDPFNGGVEIKVRLTGKRFLDIRSLSGGEKTMTALAFLFAVQEYEPASFYVLDEVDAALDKKNSEKLAQLVRGYCDRAQYLVISHNDGVISEADNLYGVSMNEHGMSKITTLKI